LAGYTIIGGFGGGDGGIVRASAVCLAVNGVDGTARRCEPHSESSSSEDQELEEERRIVREQLSKLPTPKVQ